MFIESRRDLVRLTIVHRPHRLDHRTEASKLHCRRGMDHVRFGVGGAEKQQVNMNLPGLGDRIRGLLV